MTVKIEVSQELLNEEAATKFRESLKLNHLDTEERGYTYLRILDSSKTEMRGIIFFKREIKTYVGNASFRENKINIEVYGRTYLPIIQKAAEDFSARDREARDITITLKDNNPREYDPSDNGSYSGWDF